MVRWFLGEDWGSGGFGEEDWGSGGLGRGGWWSGDFERTDWWSGGFMVRWIEGLVVQMDVRNVKRITNRFKLIRKWDTGTMKYKKSPAASMFLLLIVRYSYLTYLRLRREYSIDVRLIQRHC